MLIDTLLILLACGKSSKSEFEKLSESEKEKVLKIYRARKDSIDKGSDIGNRMLCSYHKHELPVVQMLDSAMRLGANVNCVCSLQGNVIKPSTRIPIVKKFIRKETKRVSAILHPLEIAISNQDSVAVRYLLELGADPNRSLFEKNKPLHRALSHHPIDGKTSEVQIAIAEMLVSYGANLDNQFIAFEFDVDRLSLFADFGADFNTLSNAGHAAIHTAARMRDQKVLMFLLSKGADVNLQDKNGRTALHFLADDDNSFEQIDLLMAAGADLYLTDEYGDEPIMKAARTSSANYSYLERFFDPNKSVHSKRDLEQAIAKASQRSADKR